MFFFNINKEGGSETVTLCHGLKIQFVDDKFYNS